MVAQSLTGQFSQSLLTWRGNGGHVDRGSACHLQESSAELSPVVN